MSIKEMITGTSDDKDIHAVAPIPERLRQEEKIAIITADNVEDIEFFYPYYRFTEAGYHVDVFTPEGETLKAKHGLGLKQTLKIDGAAPENYALLYLPGGKAPAELRKNEKVISFVKRFAALNKPIAAVCHGVQVLISAELVQGKQMACWPGIAKELEDAGGTFIDEALVEDGQFITSRQPGDLHRHLFGALDYLEGGVGNVSRATRKAGENAKAVN